MLNSAIIIKCYCIIIADIESTSINATRFALSIALPLVFVFILVGLIVIIALAVCIKNHHKKTHSRHTKYYYTYELTLQVTIIAILDHHCNVEHINFHRDVKIQA